MRFVTGIFWAAFCAFSLAACAQPPRPAKNALAKGAHAIVINGASAAYHVYGNGPLVVALPDGPGFAYGYLRMPNLEASFTIVYVEPVGTGGSGRLKEDEYTVKRYVGDLEELVEALGLKRFLLLGHGFGGLVAQEYALQNPQKLSGLVLYSSTPTYGKEWVDGLLGEFKTFAAKPWYPAAVAAFTGLTGLKEEREGMLDKMWPLYFADYDAAGGDYASLLGGLGFNPAPFRHFIFKEAPRYDTRQRLVQMESTTLVVAGDKDAVVPLKFSQMLASGIRLSTLAVIKGAGHLASIETPREFYDAVAPFMKKAR